MIVHEEKISASIRPIRPSDDRVIHTHYAILHSFLVIKDPEKAISKEFSPIFTFLELPYSLDSYICT